jgi:transposase
VDAEITPESHFRQRCPMREKRRKFTREFKLEAVRLVRESGKSSAQMARALGIRPDLLRSWKAPVEGKYGLPPAEMFPGNGQLNSPEDEIRRWRREKAVLRQERDCRKKAAASCAQESR